MLIPYTHVLCNFIFNNALRNNEIAQFWETFQILSDLNIFLRGALIQGVRGVLLLVQSVFSDKCSYSGGSLIRVLRVLCYGDPNR